MTQAPWQGFSESLQTPADLLDKLRHDFERVRNDPFDAYAAMDFMVTAEHIVDWLWPDGEPTAKAERMAERKREPMATVSHLASGAKHFRATQDRHQSVTGVGTRHGIFDARIFQPDVFDVGGLVVALSDGTDIGVIDLARRILERCEEIVGR